MALTDTEADALQHLMALGVSRDQSLLALVHAAWHQGKAANANDCLDHVVRGSVLRLGAATSLEVS